MIRNKRVRPTTEHVGFLDHGSGTDVIASAATGSKVSLMKDQPLVDILTMPRNQLSSSFSMETPITTPILNYNNTDRLLSIAKYESFQPTSMACSQPLHSGFLQGSHYITKSKSYENEDKNDKDSSSLKSGGRRSAKRIRNVHRTTTTATTSTSLGAIGGTHGVVLFRLSQPHVPLMTLSYYQMNTAPLFLCFQPIRYNDSYSTDHIEQQRLNSSSPNTLYLASARGSGVLIWDVSGHSLSPLTGRLGISSDSCNSSFVDPSLIRASRITSLLWKDQTTLAGTTSNSACLWDLRQSIRGSNNSPTLRFALNGSGKNVNKPIRSASSPHYVQIACSARDDQCAIMDSSGHVTVYDIRMISDHRNSVHDTSSHGHCMDEFQAFRHVGAGLTKLTPASSKENCWLTWGFDESPNTPQTRAVVKVWTNSGSSKLISGATHDDSISTPTTPPRQQPQLNSGNGSDYILAGYCLPPNGTDLACARVCPSPIDNTFLTFSVPLPHHRSKDATAATDWHIELWKVDLTKNSNESSKSNSSKNTATVKQQTNDNRPSSTIGETENDSQNNSNNNNAGLERIASIRSGNDTHNSILANSTTKYIGQVCATEVAMSSFRTNNNSNDSLHHQKQRSADFLEYESSGLMLCCLSENGYVTTHVSFLRACFL